MRKVADNGNLQPIEMAELLPDGVEVKYSLRRVLMLAVSGVDNDSVRVLRDSLWGARKACPTHEHVDVHRVNGLDRICQALAFDDRAC